MDFNGGDTQTLLELIGESLYKKIIYNILKSVLPNIMQCVLLTMSYVYSEHEVENTLSFVDKITKYQKKISKDVQNFNCDFIQTLNTLCLIVRFCEIFRVYTRSEKSCFHMDFLIDEQISSFCPDQPEGKLLSFNPNNATQTHSIFVKL